jgi:hypothetical protein
MRRFSQGVCPGTPELDGEVRSRVVIVRLIGFGEDRRYSRLQQIMAEPVSGGRVAIDRADYASIEDASAPAGFVNNFHHGFLSKLCTNRSTKKRCAQGIQKCASDLRSQKSPHELTSSHPENATA